MKKLKHVVVAVALLGVVLACGQTTPTPPTAPTATPHVGWQNYQHLTAVAVDRPWLVLMCKFSDHPEEPPGLMDTAERFFTAIGAGTGNLYDYYSDVSYGAITFAGSKVMGWYTAPFPENNHLSRDQKVSQCAGQVPAGQVDFSKYWGIVMIENVPGTDLGTPWDGQDGSLTINGTTYPHKAAVVIDPDSLNVTGTGHEVGHGLGLDHGFDTSSNRCGGGPGEYFDHWDIMGDWGNCGNFSVTFQTTPFPTDPKERAAYPPNAGPNLTAPQLLTMGWIPAGRIATYHIGGTLQTFTLTALSHPAGSNSLVVRIEGSNPDDIYTVEYRQKDGWDTGIPNNTVLIHEFKPQEAAQHKKPYSILQLNPATQRGEWLPGTTWIGPSGVAVTVESIDSASGTAVVGIRSPRAFQALDANTAYVRGTDGKLWLEHSPWGIVPPARQQVDGNVLAFQALDPNTAYVLGTDHKLWLEHGPWGAVPPARQQVDGNVLAFQALDSQDVYVLGEDGNLWLEFGPWGTVPPRRAQIDGNVLAFQALNGNAAYVLGSDGKLWLEHGVWGTVPPTRQQVDGNVASFQALDANTAYVEGTDGKLWLEHSPWGTVPPARQEVDGNVLAFQALDGNTAYVEGTDGKLWLEHSPWGRVPPTRQQVDGNVLAFQALDANTAYVEGTDGNLWLEQGPWGRVPPPRQQVDGNV